MRHGRGSPTSGKQKSREDDPADGFHGEEIWDGNDVMEGVKVGVGRVAVTMKVDVIVGGTVVKVAVGEGVCVGKLGMIVTPGTGVSVGTLGTQSF